MGNEKRRRTEAELFKDTRPGPAESERQASENTKMPSNKMDPRVMDMLVRTTRHPTMVGPICPGIVHRLGLDTLAQGIIQCHGPPLCLITGSPEDRLATLHRRAAATWQNHESDTKEDYRSQQPTGDEDVSRDSRLYFRCLRKSDVPLFCKSLACASRTHLDTGGEFGELLDLFVKTFNDWADEFLLQADDPEYRRPMLGTATIDEDLCSRIHLHIKNKNYHSFACPMCGRKYSIWRERADLDEANMVWINNPDSFCEVPPEHTLIERYHDHAQIISGTRAFMNARLVKQPLLHSGVSEYEHIAKKAIADLSLKMGGGC